RGLNNPSKYREVSHFILSNKISLLALLETRLRESNVFQVAKSIRRQWNFCSNHGASLPGRIVVMWDPAHIEVNVSFIYALCDSRARKQLWKDIIFCANRFKRTPWTLLGDFNVTRFSHEHNNSCRVTKAMEDFNYAIRSAELDDLKSTGLKFTWNNMRSGTAVISKKLDRALGNWQWFKVFADSYAHTYNPGISDHSPLSIQLMQQVQSSGRPFKFLNFWADHSDFLNIVRHEWAKTYEGPPLRKI
ncbi:Exo_endo_phos domain-containing protein, partial [Cephalotus follicularis]